MQPQPPNAATKLTGNRRSNTAVVRATLRTLLGTCVALQVCGGCAAIRKWTAAHPPGLPVQRDDRRRIRPAELDELTRAFADRYAGLLSSTCDALKKDNLDPVQRREAQ